jgi:hypothetical protein
MFRRQGRFVGEDILWEGRFVAGHIVVGRYIVEGRFVGVAQKSLHLKILLICNEGAQMGSFGQTSLNEKYHAS